MSKAPAGGRPGAGDEASSMAEAHKDKLLQGRADHGELRGGIAVSKFQAAAKKVLVTNEVMHMLASCQSELRQAQQDFKSQGEGSKSTSQPSGSKSIKARQNEAVAAADAAATYSMRSAERGRVDAAAGPQPAAAAGAQGPQQDKPALPADWGFLKNVDRLAAAPAAAAARRVGGELARPEQPGLSVDAATKAAQQAFQAPEDAGWRKVLTAKKHRQANKAELEESERVMAARFIQANWLANRLRKEQQRVKEHQLKSWADEHYAAAMAARLAAAAAAAAAGSSSRPDGSAGSSRTSSMSGDEDDKQQQPGGRRRTRGAGEEIKKAPKPVVQPWSRMVGREAPLTATTAAAAATPGSSGASKWRGAVSGTIAAQHAGKLAALAAEAGGDGAVDFEVGGEAAAADGGSQAVSTAVPVGGKVARTSSAIASMLGNLAGMFRARSNSGGGARGSSNSGAAAAGGSSRMSSAGGGGTSGSNSSSADGSSGAAAPKPRLTRLSVDLAAFFGHGSGSNNSSKAAANKSKSSGASAEPENSSSDSADGNLSAAAANSAQPGMGLGRRLSVDLAAFFGGRPTNAAATHAPAAAAPTAPPPPAAAALMPSPPLNRRRSVEFVRNLFRRNSVDVPAGAPQPGSPAAAAAAAAAAEGAGIRTAQPSRFVTAESLECQAASQLPSPLLSGCVTARASWSDAEGGSLVATSAEELAARGAAAADAYLAAASRTLAGREAVMSLCGGVSAAGGGADAADGGTVSLSGGISGAGGGGASGQIGSSGSRRNGGGATTSFVLSAGGSAAADAQCSGDATAGFEGIWGQIQRTSADFAEQKQQQQQQGEAATALTAAATPGGSKSGRQLLEPQPPAKPKVVGQGELGFQPSRPALVTAADIASSSSFFKPTGTAPTAKTSAAVNDAATALASSLYKSSAQAPGAAASSKLGVVGRGPSVTLTVDPPTSGRLSTELQHYPYSPALSDSSSTASPTNPASPSSAWPHRAPLPPAAKDNVTGGSSGSRPALGPRFNGMSRQYGQKSADMSLDAAAALVAGPPSPTGNRQAAVVVGGGAGATSQSAAAAGGQQPAKPSGRPPSGGMSSVSQKLAVARRMAENAVADGGDDAHISGSSSSSSVVSTVNLQLDGSAKRHSTSSRGSSKSAVDRLAGSATAGGGGGAGGQPRGGTASSSSSSSSSNTITGLITAQQAGLLQGISRKGSAEPAGLLKPTSSTTTASAAAVGSSHRAAWGQPAAGESPSSSKGSTSSQPAFSTDRFLSGRSSPVLAAAHQLQPVLLPAVSTKVLPVLPGFNKAGGQNLAVAASSASSRQGPVATAESKPRRNSYSNGGSKPQPLGGGGGGTAGKLQAAASGGAGGKLRPTGVGAKPAGGNGSQTDAQRRVSL